MSVSAYVQPAFDKQDLIVTGGYLLSLTAVLIIAFIIYYCLIIPVMCILYPNQTKHNTNSSGDSWITFCSFNLWGSTSTYNNALSNFCTDAPDFPLFPFAVFVLVCVAFVVRHFELKTPSGAK